LKEERKIAKDFLDQVDSGLAKNEKMNGEIAQMKSLMEHERETRDDLRKRFQEINKIRQDREKVMYYLSKMLLKVNALTVISISGFTRSDR
jgi:hypothetical protein